MAKKIKRPAANALALVDIASALVRLAAQSLTDDLSLHQVAEWRVACPAPGSQDAPEDLHLHQVADWRVTGDTWQEPTPLQGWEELHRRIFAYREAARGHREEVTSAVLLVLHDIDGNPPETVQDAIERLKVMLGGTDALNAVLDVLGGLPANLRLRPQPV